MENRNNKRKTLTGVVVSDKMMKTRVVQVLSTHTHSKYGKQVKKLEAALSGGKKLEQLMEEMETEMRRASGERHFERALELRNSIHALSALLERQKMESAGTANEDYASFFLQGGKAHVQIFRQIGSIRELCAKNVDMRREVRLALHA